MIPNPFPTTTDPSRKTWRCGRSLEYAIAIQPRCILQRLFSVPFQYMASYVDLVRGSRHRHWKLRCQLQPATSSAAAVLWIHMAVDGTGLPLVVLQRYQ